MKRYSPAYDATIIPGRHGPTMRPTMAEDSNGEYVKREDCKNSENEAFAEIQRLLCGVVKYCENYCPTRETCVDGKRTKEQEECPLFTTVER
jgi:hypothetical protein